MENELQLTESEIVTTVSHIDENHDVDAMTCVGEHCGGCKFLASAVGCNPVMGYCPQCATILVESLQQPASSKREIDFLCSFAGCDKLYFGPYCGEYVVQYYYLTHFKMITTIY